MIFKKNVGVNYLITQKDNKNSYLAIGSLIKAISLNMKVAFIDEGNLNRKTIQTFENLFLTNSFKKMKCEVDFFNFKSKDIIQKSVLPNVEYYSINKNIFLKEIENFDLIIFENFSFENFTKQEIQQILQNKKISCDALFISNENIKYNSLEENFNEKFYIEYIKNKSLMVKKNFTVINGEEILIDLLFYGLLFEKIIDKNKINLFFFDRIDNIYSEKDFFKNLKNSVLENNLYKKFDFIYSGIKRYENGKKRIENNIYDIKEAKSSLDLLKTSSNKDMDIFCSGLFELKENEILDKEYIIDKISEINSEICFSDKHTCHLFKDNSNNVYNIKKISNLKKQ